MLDVECSFVMALCKGVVDVSFIHKTDKDCAYLPYEERVILLVDSLISILIKH